MSKRVVRPWDKSHDVRRPHRDATATAAAASEEVPSYSPPSYVKIDGIRYYSDRFYLNRIDDNDAVTRSTPATQPSYPWSCACGARGEPPSLDIRRLVASLDLQAAILASYTLDREWMIEALPSLFGPNATIPTLVLHGHKGFSTRPSATVDKNIQQAQELDSPCREESPLQQPLNWKASSNDYRSSPPPQQPVLQESNAADEENAEDEENDESLGCWNTQDEFLPPLLSTIATPVKHQYHKSPSPLRHKAKKLREAQSNLRQHVPLFPVTQHDTPTTTRSSASLSSSSVTFGPCAYFTKVEPVWVPPPIATASSQLDEKERKRGVHHPKYMLLLERSGSLVVVVSTANLTRPGSVDASWIQRFEPVTTNTNNASTTANSGANNDNTSSGKKLKWSDVRRDGSDFGYVLANFLHCQSQAAARNDNAAVDNNNDNMDCMLPNAFLQANVGFGLKELPRRFQFDQSQVHLIATVPGDYGGRHTTLHLGGGAGTSKERSFLYGPQRVADILHRLSSNPKQPSSSSSFKSATSSPLSSVAPTPWLPPSLLSNTDRLVMQTTSIGGKWTRDSLSRIVRSYLGHDDNPDSDKDSTKKRSLNEQQQDILECLDIVWPTQDFMQLAASRVSGRLQQPLVTQNIVKSTESFRSGGRSAEAQHCGFLSKSTTSSFVTIADEEAHGAFVFMSSESFSSMELSCLSRMVMYEPTDASASRILPPHIKSVARLLDTNDYHLRQDFGKALEYFSWFLLSSACLSHGAQGKRQVTVAARSNEERYVVMTYSNFELGVLFCSRWQGQPKSDRLYCWKPAQCSCQRYGCEAIKRAESTLIHLPIPYALRPHPYQNDPDEADFCATPYLHEIPEGTGCIGHMRLTPYGAKLASSPQPTIRSKSKDT